MQSEFARTTQFVPVAEIINHHIQDVVEQMGAYGIPAGTSLANLHYDGQQIDAASLIKRFPQTVDEKRVDRPLQRLLYELKIAGLLEKGGLEEVNTYLNGLLIQSQNENMDTNQAKELSAEINRILHLAIYLFPHLASSIRIQRKKNDPHAEIDAIFTDTQATELILPLPFENSIQWEKNPKIDLSRSVECSFAPSQGKTKADVIMFINLQGKSKGRSVIPVNAFERIEFSDSENYTPFVHIPAGIRSSESLAGKCSFVPRPSRLDHYLHYIHSIKRDDVLMQIPQQNDDPAKLMASVAPRL